MLPFLLLPSCSHFLLGLKKVVWIWPRVLNKSIPNLPFLRVEISWMALGSHLPLEGQWELQRAPTAFAKNCIPAESASKDWFDKVIDCLEENHPVDLHESAILEDSVG